MDKVDGIIAEREFVMMSKDFFQDKKALLLQTEELEKNINRLKGKQNNSITRKQTLTKYIEIEHLEREHILELIDCIYVGKYDSTTRKTPVKIVWNF